ncbi:hypothetical protein BKK79_20180 [Cupriavidus sp. USMAA2-4]|uniref:hypothetical protein n=1 Tax=Cupriavidus sp. USMAA2-4 TaxID=876364 RepID=UPI0008A6B2EB|nr:hypothetical protein [Cupriavidus sp. USMAA2-4]AOY93794.1 hypothetical protein BKK79_19815 [Cupriavidus sp. USMAA2-4]AOY93863.1 hypothetical protein BKK79_20180 [Cupriavidus sp. USMAA2-4]
MTTTKTKYEKLDALIIAAIVGSPIDFGSIYQRDVKKECERIADEENKARGLSRWHEIPGWRVLDRRLQAMRKAGKIRHTGKGWVPAQEAA